jgi:predicted Zn-dependent protease
VAGCDDWDVPINLVSTATTRQLGLETWNRILSSEPRSRDPAEVRLARQIADRLLQAASEEPNRWEIIVFARPAINAFALPGNRIGVFEGMFRVATSDDQLAAVIGHEIGHNQANHGQRRLNAEAWRDLGLKALFTALQLGDIPHSNAIAAVLGAGAEYGLLLPYSRRQEIEADRIGVQIARSAGFDPREAIELWRRMDQIDGDSGPSFLATHPAPAERIEALRMLLAGI